MKTRTAWVVGGGLAGSFVSTELCKRGFAVTQWEDGNPSASSVAGGIFNPVTGKWKNFSWESARFLESLHDFFKQPGFESLGTHLTLKDILFPFNSVQELNDWSHKDVPAALQKLVEVYSVPKDPEIFNNPLGGIRISGCGWLDVNPFLAALKDILSHNYLYSNTHKPFYFDDNFRSDSAGIPTRFEDAPEAIVFCEGMAAIKNPIWKGIPLFDLKGEVLELEVSGYDPDYISVGGVFLIPTGNGKFISGSTYEREPETSGPSEKGLREIEGHLRSKLKVPFKVVGHRAGIRPSTMNRRPILGRHPRLQRCWILNGLGTKGVMQAPWCAAHLADLIEKNSPSEKIEFDLDRYIRDYL